MKQVYAIWLYALRQRNVLAWNIYFIVLSVCVVGVIASFWYL